MEGGLSSRRLFQEVCLNRGPLTVSKPFVTVMQEGTDLGLCAESCIEGCQRAILAHGLSTKRFKVLSNSTAEVLSKLRKYGISIVNHGIGP
jgi:hypothetical protein